jgi:hypothetical protein
MKKTKPNVPFNEYFLHYIWKTKQIDTRHLATTDGKKIEILHFGFYNEDSGPDFLNAVVKLDGTIWAGNIEIHVLSSDWEKHNHHTDDAYDNVILHVVYYNDKNISGAKYTLPCLELKNKIPKILIQKFENLLQSKKWVPCADIISHVDDAVFDIWKYGLVVEKLQIKESFMRNLLKKYTYDWEACFYILLARYFGGKVNDFPFESLAERTPIELVRKNISDPLTIQALFFGQAGMLDLPLEDKYYLTLKNIYSFLKQKYNIHPLQDVVWKYSKLRPLNFPTVRIAQFSSLKRLGSSMFSSLMEASTLEEMYNILQANPDEYWNTHFRFGPSSVFMNKNVKRDFMDILIINAFLPLAFIFFETYGMYDKKEWIFTIMENIRSEKNKIITRWHSLGNKSDSALDSQALLQLYNHYCQNKFCLSCKIGHNILCKTP